MEIQKFIQSVGWATDGNQMAICSKDLKVRVFDARLNTMVLKANSHQNIRDARVLWINDNYIITTGITT